MDKKVKFVELTKMNTSNDVHNESFENKIPKKKMYDRSSTELNTYTEEVTCEKDIEQNITDTYSRKNVNQKVKSEINTSTDISLGNNCSIDNENVLTKKSKKKRKHDKSLNLIHTNTNHDTEIFNRMCEEVNKQNINVSDYTKNVIQITKSELNASSDITLENKCSKDNNNVATKKPKKKKKHNKSLNSIEINTYNDANHRTYEKDNKHNINDPESTENIIKIKMSEINDLTTKKPKKKKNHNKSLNISTEAAAKSFDRTFVEVNEQNIIDSYSKNVSRKRKSEINALANISLVDNCSTDNENVPTKKTKKKKNHDESLNSIDFNTNHDTKIQIFERTYEVVNDQNINNSDFRENVNRTIESELNTSSEISSENKCSLDYDNVAIKKPKKKKKHDKRLDLIKLNTINDAVNDSDSTKIISQKRMTEINTLPTKTPKKKKNFNLIEFNKNHETESQIFERTYNEINDSYYRENVNQMTKPKLNTSSDILLENKLSMDNDNVAIKKPKKKKKHDKSLNSIELNTNNDAHFSTYEKDNEHSNNDSDSDSADNKSQKRMSEMNAFADISLGNDFSKDNENVLTKKPKKERNHNKSLNVMHTNTNHDTEIFEKMSEEVSEPNMNNSDTKALAFASLEINHSLDNEHLATKGSKKRKKHDKITNNHRMPMISQDQTRLKTLLNSMELYHFEESSTNNTNLNLKRFNLMKYLINKDPSLKNHPNFEQIYECLSKKIKLTINKICEIKASDILLLKTIGKIILKKIVDKIDSAKEIKDLAIKLPPECMENKIHFIETTLSRLPNKSKMDIIKKHNPLVKLRVFNKDEDNMIREYWSKFQKEYNISNILPFLSNGLEIALSPTERLQFIRYISAGLPNRLLYSVFNRFNILFNEYQDKTCFSEEEDQLIIKVDECDAIKNKFSVLSLILNRTRLQLYRRHEVLKNQHIKCEKFVWDDEKRQELFTNILLETNTEHWTHLKNLTITKDILIKIAKNLGKNITYNKVRYQWNHLYTMLFCEKPILMSTFNLIMLNELEQINPKHWSDLNWIEITNKLYPGAKSKVICSFFHTWVDKKVPSDIKENIRDTLDYLRQHEVDKLKKRIDKHGEREFPRLTVKDYDLLVNNQ